MARRYLIDAQSEVPYIVSRWMLGEAPGVGSIYDDVGGVRLGITGQPTLGNPSLVRGDQRTSALGGYTTQANGFTTSVSFPDVSFTLTNGLSLEAVTAPDQANLSSFYLINAPAQFALEVIGTQIAFSVWTTALHTLTTTTAPLFGPSQLITCTYDPTAQLQAIYVDGAQVISQSLSGAVAGATTGHTQILMPAVSSATVALGQDVAVYNGALPQTRITQHYQAFSQQWQDPGHVYTFPRIAVAN